VSPRNVASRALDRRHRAAATAASAWRGLQGTLGGRFVEAFFEMRAIDRALALASKLFIAILPLSILVTAVVSGQAFGDELVSRFGLTGGGASAARTLFAAPAQVQAAVGLLGLVILTSSILSFASALQRVYLDCWRLDPAAGAARSRLLWLAGLLVWVTVASTVHEGAEGSSVAVLSWLIAVVAGGAFFLWTPFVLLGRRVRVRRLLPTALATGVALGVLAVGSDVVMPELVTQNTARYGLIGLTFSLVTWLFSGAVLVVSAAILGALLERTEGAGPRPAST
jgi:membrane protein